MGRLGLQRPAYLPQPRIRPPEMTLALNPLSRFVLRVILWLPLCFAAWYFSSILWTLPVAQGSSLISAWLFPDLVEGLYQRGNLLQVVSAVAVPMPEQGPGAVGELVFTINPLSYGYSIPLYTALVLASPAEDATRALRWLLGTLLLFAFQLFGVLTNVLKILLLDLQAETAAVLSMPGWSHELLVIAYQFGYLILPPVAPIVLWVGQFQTQLLDLTATPQTSARR